MKPSKPVSDYMKRIGAKGGKTTGKSKSRGDSKYYSRLVAKRKRKINVAREGE